MFRTRASCTIHPMNKRLRGPLRYLEATFQATLIVANKEERKTEKGNEYSTLRHCPSICPRRFLYLSYLTYFFFLSNFLSFHGRPRLYSSSPIFPTVAVFFSFPKETFPREVRQNISTDRNNILCENSFFVILVKKQFFPGFVHQSRKWQILLQCF